MDAVVGLASQSRVETRLAVVTFPRRFCLSLLFGSRQLSRGPMSLTGISCVWMQPHVCLAGHVSFCGEMTVPRETVSYTNHEC